jgi:UPF0716 protein FxsA
MLFRLVTLFVLLPLLELVVLIQLGRWLGLLGTIALVVGTGLLGAALARRQGLRAWLAIQNELRQGRMPAAAMLDGLLILVGGIVLLTPGLLTDLSGLALLFPPTRNAVKRYLRKRLERAIETGDARFTMVMLR